MTTATDEQTSEPIPGQTTIEDQIAEANGAAPRKGAAQNAAYTRASARLRTAHRPEFDGYLAEEYKAAGLPWKRRLSPEQRAQRDAEERLAKAKDKLAKLLDEYPELRPAT